MRIGMGALVHHPTFGYGLSSRIVRLGLFQRVRFESHEESIPVARWRVRLVPHGSIEWRDVITRVFPPYQPV